MKPLGTIEELPQEYVRSLTAKNLYPLWPSLRSVMPAAAPGARTQPTLWKYADVRPLLLRAGELTPIEKAERRVLVLANPGHGLANMQATPIIYLGLQLILPGEVAPNHRHTPNAVRIVVEGEGAFTGVDGEKCPMRRGDLILTPSGRWHEHGHEGRDPVIWLDVLDLPLLYYLEASYVEDGSDVAIARDAPHSDALYTAAGLAPAPGFVRSDDRNPLIRYPWERTRAALESLQRSRAASEPLQVAYVNPETGRDCFPTIAFSALMLRPGETRDLGRRSPAQVFHAIEGSGHIAIGGAELAWSERDTLAAPCFAPVTIANASSHTPAFVVIADESPVHRALGIYQTRG
jgi:gentisate 1,2-dioxygenase